MSRLHIISKYFIKTSIQETFRNKKLKPPIVAALMLLIVALMSMPFAAIVTSLYKPLKLIGQQGMLLSMIFLSGSTILFFFGIFTVMNIFYFSGDIEELLPLPFKSSEIVFGKFLAVIINMSLYSGIMLLPLIAYGLSSDSGPIYYIYMVIAVVLVTVFPMILASGICMLLMRFTSLSKHKDLFKIFAGCLSLALVIFLNLFFQPSNENASQDTIIKMLSEGNNSGMKILTGIFIINKFCANAMINNADFQGVINIILAIIFSVCIFLVYYIIAGRLYLKGVIGISESYSKRKNVLKQGNRTAENSPVKAFIKKDIKIILRTPHFFINCIAMLIYMPVILGVMLLSNGGLQKIRDIIAGNPKYYGLILVIIMMGSVLCIASGGAGLTALSREGKDFIVSKYIPIDFKTQLKSKIIVALLINGFSVVIITVGMILLEIKSVLFLCGGIISVLTVIFITLFGIYSDFKEPRLDWDDEKSMGKNNFTPMIIMFIMLVSAAVFIGLSFIIKNYFVIFIVISSAEIIASKAFYDRIVILADRIYNNLEEY